MKQEFWDPKGFEEAVRGDGLDKLQEKGRARREEERMKGEREKVEFVSGVVESDQPAKKERNSRWEDRSAGVGRNADEERRDERDVPSRRDGDRQRGDDRRREARDGRDIRNRKDEDRDRDRKRRRSRSRSREKERDRGGRYRDYEYRTER